MANLTMDLLIGLMMYWALTGLLTQNVASTMADDRARPQLPFHVQKLVRRLSESQSLSLSLSLNLPPHQCLNFRQAQRLILLEMQKTASFVAVLIHQARPSDRQPTCRGGLEVGVCVG